MIETERDIKIVSNVFKSSISKVLFFEDETIFIKLRRARCHQKQNISN